MQRGLSLRIANQKEGRRSLRDAEAQIPFFNNHVPAIAGKNDSRPFDLPVIGKPGKTEPQTTLGPAVLVAGPSN